MKLNNSICIGILLILGLVIIYILNKPNNIEKFTDSPSGDVTVVETPSATESQTPSTDTPSPSPSATVTDTSSPSPSATVTDTPSPSITVTQTPSPSPTQPYEPVATLPSNTTTVTTAPPPGFNTPSINDMSRMGLYTLGRSSISQVGGEGPNNYFQPNIFIKRKPNTAVTVSTQPPPTNNTIISSNTSNMASISQYWTDYSYGTEGGYNFAQPENTTTDPISTAEQNARANYERETALNGSCRNCAPAQYDFEMFYNNTQSPTTAPTQAHFTHSCQMKEFVPGYQIQPPKCWDVPAVRPPVCLGNNERLPSAVFDRGTPLNALNLDTSVGSIMPRFRYTEESRT